MCDVNHRGQVKRRRKDATNVKIEDRTSQIEHQAATGPTYWRSLDELADTPEFRRFVENEFPTYAPSLITKPTRRAFLKLMGASVALAGLTGCRRWPQRKLAPYNARPEGQTPGEPEHYATAYELGGVAKPLLITAYDGRPVKVEGNAEHPASGGAAEAFAQASILDVYDPHRSRAVKRDGKASTWAAFDQWAAEHFKRFEATEGEGLAFLMEATGSPTVLQTMVRKGTSKFPKAKGCCFEPLEDRNAVKGAKLAFGQPMRAHYDLSGADVIVSLDSDFLSDHPDHLRLARQFTDGRRDVDATGKMNRLYVAESAFTVTGAAADERLPARVADIETLAVLVAAELGIGNAPAGANDALTEHAKTVAADLGKHKGRAAVIVGATLSAETHALCHAINEKVGAFGKTVTFSEQVDLYMPDDLEGAQTLVILGGNPLFDGTPAVKKAIESAQTVVHLSHYENETSKAAAWHLPRAHYLEAWGDARSYDGTVSIVQPLIMPLFGGRSVIELLAQLTTDAKPDGYELVKQTHGLGEKAWRKAVHDGLIANSAYATATPRVTRVTQKPVEPADGVELVVRPDSKIYDGRFANNGWLQELPEPMTRMTWDNVVLVSVPDAKRWGVKHGDMLSITVNEQAVELPVFVQPGHPVGTVGVTLGYGRTSAGPVGDKVGFDTYPLRAGEGFVYRATVKPTGESHKLANTNDHFAIDAIAAKRREKLAKEELVRSATLEQFNHDPKHALGHAHTVALPVITNEDLQNKPGFNADSQSVVPGGFSKDRGPQQFVNPLDTAAMENDSTAPQYQWGMVVDLNTCIGCGACVVACQAENNIPIVGKSQVIMNREMHWLRIDRYYTGDPEKPEQIKSLSQPMMCVHCETAPCEQVCPVAATVHDHEGLNVMVYNRCIGTRYCSNNCPYKVRRFNYFDWNARDPRITGSTPPYLGIPDQQQLTDVDPVARMHFNPEVTVRMRGVMEKCTYCVQRIQLAKQNARVENAQGKRDEPRVGDDELQTACQQTCATHSIVFGNLADKDSKVARLQYESPRAYGALDHLNLRPRTKYLAKITNPAHSDKAENKHAPEKKGGHH